MCRSEETRGADRSAPIAIVLAIGTSAVFGLGYVLALVFSIQARLVIITLTSPAHFEDSDRRLYCHCLCLRSLHFWFIQAQDTIYAQPSSRMIGQGKAVSRMLCSSCSSKVWCMTTTFFVTSMGLCRISTTLMHQAQQGDISAGKYTMTPSLQDLVTEEEVLWLWV